MRILVTGAEGFIGKHLIMGLKNNKHTEIDEYDLDTGEELLDQYCRDADLVYHLAGANRPKEEAEYIYANVDFTKHLINTLKKQNNLCPVIFASSVQAMLDNPYGSSKKAGEDMLFEYSKETGAKVLVYRFSNVFGKWCRPNYNSVVATFCYNVAHDLPITVNDPKAVLKLLYIDDLVEELLRAAQGKETWRGSYCKVPVFHLITLGTIAELIRSFKSTREELSIPDMSDPLTKKLYSTYLSYLPKQDIGYELTMHTDQRGSFTEFIKQTGIGQLSVNISKPGVVKGNHWHNTKHEKFLVVSGTGVIRLRNVTSTEVIIFNVNGEKLEVIDIPPGYVHNLENLGNSDMVTIIWANECYLMEKPDTYSVEV
ncbi:MAG TPA: capsular polysaccharide biosynthesis protein CapF [Mobilitalea sp.]|nr:capsular polysaccharide biosynthesis protein CapF [Mobilitalea sp.]